MLSTGPVSALGLKHMIIPPNPMPFLQSRGRALHDQPATLTYRLYAPSCRSIPRNRRYFDFVTLFDLRIEALALDQLGKQAAFLDELVIGAVLDDAAAFQV